MANIRILSPSAQPAGSFRIIDWIESNFANPIYEHFWCAVAFAKIKPFYKLDPLIQSWKAKGKTSEVIFGIDHKGTSVQALKYSLANFDHTYILHSSYSTFHPKLYIFNGNNNATLYYGSNNFTPGGLETNFEGGILLDLTLPADEPLLDEVLSSFTSLLPSSIPCSIELTNDILSHLFAKGLLLDETATEGSRRSPVGTGSSTTSIPLGIFGSYSTKPPKSIPKAVLIKAAANAGILIPASATSGSSAESLTSTTLPTTEIPTTTASTSVAVPLIVNGLVMQVSPHPNGEIHLSKIAVDQNPSFFGYPFNGRSIPKKPTNPSYPQRDPDPIVNIYVYDNTGTLVHTELNYDLNTVFYSKKSEIRITITPGILSALSTGSDFPIMVITNSVDPNCNYDLCFYDHGSTEYMDYLQICNQTLPTGGNPIARKMGWI